MKNGNYTYIFIFAFIAAGAVCLAAGLIVYFTASSQTAYVIGVAMTVVGAADTFISLLALVLVFVKNRLLLPTDDKKQNNDNKND